jgi:hypothetical protein
MDGRDLVAVEVDRRRLVDGDDGKGASVVRLDDEDRIQFRDALLGQHVWPGQRVRHHDGALRGKHLVAVGVVEVPVRVEHDPRRSRVERGQGRLDLLAGRNHPVIDEEDTVLAHTDADVSTGAGQHEDAVDDLRRPDLDLGGVLGAKRNAKSCRYEDAEKEDTESLVHLVTSERAKESAGGPFVVRP